MRGLTLALAACLATGCASGPVVQTDRDPTIDLSHYRSYAWKQEPPISNPLLKQRVVAGVDAELAAKGWQLVPEPQANLVLVGNVSARDDATLDYFYEGNGWVGWEWRPGAVYPMQRVELRTFTIGTLVIDAFDATSKRAVWRGVAQGTVPDSEEHRSRDAMEAVHGMFADFPRAAAESPR
jgi:hypothetical protein